MQAGKKMHSQYWESNGKNYIMLEEVLFWLWLLCLLYSMTLIMTSKMSYKNSQKWPTMGLNFLLLQAGAQNFLCAFVCGISFGCEKVIKQMGFAFFLHKTIQMDYSQKCLVHNTCHAIILSFGSRLWCTIINRNTFWTETWIWNKNPP